MGDECKCGDESVTCRLCRGIFTGDDATFDTNSTNSFILFSLIIFVFSLSFDMLLSIDVVLSLDMFIASSLLFALASILLLFSSAVLHTIPFSYYIVCKFMITLYNIIISLHNTIISYNNMIYSNISVQSIIKENNHVNITFRKWERAPEQSTREKLGITVGNDTTFNCDKLGSDFLYLFNCLYA